MKLLWLAAAAVIIVLAAFSLMSQPTIAPAEDNGTILTSRCDSDSECFVGGCSSEICSTDPNAVSACIFKPEFECYRLTTCGCVENRCQWEQTPEFDTCFGERVGPDSPPRNGQ
jgi:eight-cysteine-cluster-containing protein